jgi:phosphopantothenoylcysteine decarboxylase/phosphopantothenate--cysteine ligase
VSGRGGRGARLEVWITGGGTREPIDAVRFIGNVSTGRMAVELARAAARAGDRVTLFLADAVPAPRSRRIRVVRFTTSADLRERLAAAAAPPPDAIVHAAAVSDYAAVPVRGKIPSGRPGLSLRLRPLPKLVTELRRRHPRAVLCSFKLESRVSRAELLRRAAASARRSGVDLVFANRLEDVGAEHRGFLVDPARGSALEARTRAAAARAVLSACRERVAAMCAARGVGA